MRTATFALPFLALALLGAAEPKPADASLVAAMREELKRTTTELKLPLLGGLL